MAEVQTAVRRVEKATLVSIRLDDRPGVGALMKHGFVHALALQPGDT